MQPTATLLLPLTWLGATHSSRHMLAARPSLTHLPQIFLRSNSRPADESLTSCVSQVHSSPSVSRGQDATRKRPSSSVPAENSTKRKKRDETDITGRDLEPMIFTKKFACPFWKAGVDKMCLNRSCGGPGWGQIHRVKCVSQQTPETGQNELTSVANGLENISNDATFRRASRIRMSAVDAWRTSGRRSASCNTSAKTRNASFGPQR